MPRYALRLLLAFCLVLNGIGSAMASAGIPAVMEQAALAVEAAPRAGESCAHGDGDTTKGAMVALEHSAPTVPHPADCGLDCCDQGPCDGACVHLSQATLLEVPVVTMRLDQSCMTAALPTGNAPPALLHPIRPPIG